MSKTMLKLLDTVPTIDDLRVGSVGLYKIDRLLICYDSSSALLQVAIQTTEKMQDTFVLKVTNIF